MQVGLAGDVEIGYNQRIKRRACQTLKTLKVLQMGLDMMLYRGDFTKDGPESSKDEIMYWRKANAIHNWFVKNVQDGVDECQPSKVTKPQLKALLGTVEQALEGPSTAEHVLPTTSGFFFGHTSYDSCYMNGLKSTLEELGSKIANDPEDQLYTYRASW